MDCVVTSKLIKLACAWLCLHACLGHAQDAEGLSRARRDADNPLRLIIEASKLKPRSKSGEPDLAASARAEKHAARAPSGNPAATAAAPPTDGGGVVARTMQSADASTTEPLVAAPMLEPTMLPLLAELQTETVAYLPPSPPAPPQPEPLIAVQTSEPTPESPQTQGLAPAAPPPVSTGEARPELDVAVAARSLPTVNALSAPVPAVTLQLEGYVEPQLPERIRRRLQADAEVVVNFTVNPDGSVTEPSVRSSSDRSLNEIALDAVRQWRYRPIAAAQGHAVQLVFRLRD
jgi:TonB family protein